MDELREKIKKILGQAYSDGILEEHPSTTRHTDRILALLPQWISVETRLPELPEGRVFIPTLVLREENPYPTTRLFTGKGWQTRATVTYWMEYKLPQPPKEG